MENGGKLLKAVGRLTTVVILEVEPIKHIESAFFYFLHLIQFDEHRKGLTA